MADKFKAVQVANEFIDLSLPRGLSNLALQKLTYIAHGWHLAVTGVPLVDEPVRAWKWGPVFPSLYHNVKHNEDKRIQHPLELLDVQVDENGSLTWTSETPRLPPDAENAKAAISNVWVKYGHLSPSQLVDLTHESGTPWDEVTEVARNQYGNDFTQWVTNLVIPDKLIEKHYLELWRKQSKQAG